MRISDWSSDVCSSDLTKGPSLPGRRLAGPAGSARSPAIPASPQKQRRCEACADDLREMRYAPACAGKSWTGLDSEEVKPPLSSAAPSSGHWYIRGGLRARPRRKRERKSSVKGKRVAVKVNTGG